MTLIDRLAQLVQEAAEIIPGCGQVPQLERAALTGRRAREGVAAG